MILAVSHVVIASVLIPVGLVKISRSRREAAAARVSLFVAPGREGVVGGLGATF